LPGALGLGKQLGTTTDEGDAPELCRIISELAITTFWISKRLDNTKEEIVAVDMDFIHMLACWYSHCYQRFRKAGDGFQVDVAYGR